MTSNISKMEADKRQLDSLLKALRPVHAHHPEANFITKFVEGQRNKGRDDGDTLQQVIQHIVTQGITQNTTRICEANAKVSKGIELLTALESWPNLKSIAEHALSNAVQVLSSQDDSKSAACLLAL
jgi:hypothetical protein